MSNIKFDLSSITGTAVRPNGSPADAGFALPKAAELPVAKIAVPAAPAVVPKPPAPIVPGANGAPAPIVPSRPNLFGAPVVAGVTTSSSAGIVARRPSEPEKPTSYSQYAGSGGLTEDLAAFFRDRSTIVSV